MLSSGSSKNSSRSGSKTIKKSRINNSSSMQSRVGQKSINQRKEKEEKICEKITEIFNQREQTMIQIVKQTMFEDKKMYKSFRKEQEPKLQEKEKEKLRLLKKGKKKKNMKAINQNVKDRFMIICQLIYKTQNYFKEKYYENDNYRALRLIEIQTGAKNPMTGSQYLGSMGAQKKMSISDVTNALQKQQKELKASLEEREERSRSEGAKLNKNAFAGNKYIRAVQDFLESPFKDDKKFALGYLAVLSRDRISDCEELLNKIFMRSVFNVILGPKKGTDEEVNRHKAFEILCNMIHSENLRHKLAQEDCFQRIFEKLTYTTDSKVTEDIRILEKLSWLSTLISYYEDMYDHIKRINLLQFVIKISGKSYPSQIRSNSVLAISLLTYNDKLFEEIISCGVIDLIMELCESKDNSAEVKQYSTLALVHFALNKESIKILITNGVLNLFNTFSQATTNESDSPSDQQADMVIQTNVAWIFLALCTNNITGQRMLRKGITRDMFLVSCNPNYHQIRHLVITGFAELGRCEDNAEPEEEYPPESQRIKETATVGLSVHIENDAQKNIDILISFSTSDKTAHQYTAFWALKDYILLYHEKLIPNIKPCIDAFQNGCLSDAEKIQAKCANALSFLVTHKLVYQSISDHKEEQSCFSDDESKMSDHVKNQKDTLQERKEFIDAKMHHYHHHDEEAEAAFCEEIKQKPVEHVLDAVMYLSGNESKFIRTTAFSILSSLSKFCSLCQTVMAQIYRDIQIPEGLDQKDYMQYLRDRLSGQREMFNQTFKNVENETKFSGLYHLLRLSQEPTDHEISEAAKAYLEFIKLPYVQDPDHLLNERYFVKVFHALKHTQKPEILKALLMVIKWYVDLDESDQQGGNTIIHNHKKDQDMNACNTAQSKIDKRMQIITPHTILWMLEIIEKQRNEKYLCCMTAKVLLAIVNKHQILFEYQEVAIIKKFNKALQNISVFDGDDEEEGDEKDIISQIFKTKSDNGGEEEEDEKEVSESLEELQDEKQFEEQYLKVVDTEQYSPIIRSSHRVDEARNAQKELLSEDPLQQKSENMISDWKHKQMHAKGKSLQHRYDSQAESLLNQMLPEVRPGFAKQSTRKINLFKKAGKKSPPVSLIVNKGKLEVEHISNPTIRGEVQPTDEERKERLEPPKIEIQDAEYRHVHQAVIDSDEGKIQGHHHEGTAHHCLVGDNLIAKNKSKSGNLEVEINENIPIEEIDPNDIETIEVQLRDALIKAFMVIFTNEHSQHLLLNRDLIDIALNCLEHSGQTSTEAKRKVARLISIIFKFPQVQEKVMVPGSTVVKGICDLLEQRSQVDIIRHTLKACTYISMNYSFIQQSLYSLDVLKAMMILLEEMEQRNDQFNIVSTMKNILKGDKPNKMFFYVQGGTKKFMKIILDRTDLPMLEMCLQAIAEQATYKKVMVKLLSNPQELGQLKHVIEKCLELTDNWNAGSTQTRPQTGGSRPGTLQTNPTDQQLQKVDEMKNSSRISDQASKFSYSLDDDTNVQIPDFMKNELKTLGDVDTEASNISKLGRIRNSLYYIIARSIKFGLDPGAQFLVQKCKLIKRVIKDLELQQSNSFMFQNLLNVMQNLKLEPIAVVQLLQNNYSLIIDQIYETKDKDRRVSILRCMVNLVLKAKSESLDNRDLMNKLLDMGIQSSSVDEQMVENTLWFCTQLCHGCSPDLEQPLITCFLENKLFEKVIIAIQSDQERIILQSLHLLTKLASIDRLRPEIAKYREQLFNKLNQISQKQFKKYSLEIQTAICQCLEQISCTKTVASEESFEEKYRRVQTMQQDQVKLFNKMLIQMASEKEYTVRRLDDPALLNPDALDVVEEEVTQNQATQQTYFDAYRESNITEMLAKQETMGKVDETLNEESYSKQVTQILELDDLDHKENSNELIESIVNTLSNLSEDIEMQQELIQNGLIQVVRKYFEQINLLVRNPQEELFDFLETGSLNLVKSLVKIILNTSQVAEIKKMAINQNVYQLINLGLDNLNDYEVQTMLYQAAGNYLITGLPEPEQNEEQISQEIRQEAQQAGLLDRMVKAFENSSKYKIKRICKEYLGVIFDE